MAEISLVSINIERSNHLDTVLPFLERYKPDVVTFQECMERDVPLYTEKLGMECFFTPLSVYGARNGEQEGLEGQAIFSRKFLSTSHEFYAG
jgi:hypothetical protein